MTTADAYKTRFTTLQWLPTLRAPQERFKALSANRVGAEAVIPEQNRRGTQIEGTGVAMDGRAQRVLPGGELICGDARQPARPAGQPELAVFCTQALHVLAG